MLSRCGKPGRVTAGRVTAGRVAVGRVTAGRVTHIAQLAHWLAKPFNTRSTSDRAKVCAAICVPSADFCSALVTAREKLAESGRPW